MNHQELLEELAKWKKMYKEPEEALLMDLAHQLHQQHPDMEIHLIAYFALGIGKLLAIESFDEIEFTFTPTEVNLKYRICTGS